MNGLRVAFIVGTGNVVSPVTPPGDDVADAVSDCSNGDCSAVINQGAGVTGLRAGEDGCPARTGVIVSGSPGDSVEQDRGRRERRPIEWCRTEP